MNRRKKGRPSRCPHSLILFLGTLRVVFRLFPWQLEGFARRLGKLISTTAPDYRTLSLRRPKLQFDPALGHVPPRGGEEVIASDAIRIKVTNRGEWTRRKRKAYIGIHVAMLGEAILERTGSDIGERRAKDSLEAEARRLGLRRAPQPTWGKSVDKLLGEFVQPALIQPTFVLDHPVELCPLAKRKTAHPSLAERFKLFIGGLELGNAFSELNDPLDQASQFQQQEQRRLGDVEAQPLDEDFLISLEHGIFPTSGLRIGLDRLVTLFTKAQPMYDVVPFTTLRASR